MLVTLAFLYACGNDLKDVKMVNATKESPDESMKNVVMTYTDNGVNRAILKTPLILKYGTAQTRTEFPEGLTVDFFNEKGERSSFLRAGYGVLNELTHQLVIEKNVKMINYGTKDTLKTQYLVWKMDSAIITSNRLVTIDGLRGHAQGNSFRGRENFTKYRLKNAKVTYFYNQNDTL